MQRRDLMWMIGGLGALVALLPATDVKAQRDDPGAPVSAGAPNGGALRFDRLDDYVTMGPAPLDFTSDVPGAETLITRYEACPPGASVELWKVVGEDHFMSLTEAGRSAIFDYFDTHRAPCTGDLDGSGQTSFGDLTQLLSAWGPCAGCPEDLDGSGHVGFPDLTALLSAWGSCL